MMRFQGSHRQNHGRLQNGLLPLHSHSEARSKGPKDRKRAYASTRTCSVPCIPLCPLARHPRGGSVRVPVLAISCGRACIWGPNQVDAKSAVTLPCFCSCRAAAVLCERLRTFVQKHPSLHAVVSLTALYYPLLLHVPDNVIFVCTASACIFACKCFKLVVLSRTKAGTRHPNAATSGTVKRNVGFWREALPKAGHVRDYLLALLSSSHCR